MMTTHQYLFLAFSVVVKIALLCLRTYTHNNISTKTASICLEMLERNSFLSAEENIPLRILRFCSLCRCAVCIFTFLVSVYTLWAFNERKVIVSYNHNVLYIYVPE